MTHAATLDLNDLPLSAAIAEPRGGRETALIPASMVSVFVRAGEFALIAGVGAVTATSATASHLSGLEVAGLVLALATLSVLAFDAAGLYRSHRFATPTAAAHRLILGWMAASCTLIAGLHVAGFGHLVSPAWLLSWFALGLTGLGAGRLGLGVLVRRLARSGALYRRAVIYGAGAVTVDLVRQLEADVAGDIRIAGIFDDRDDERVARTISGYRRLGGLKDLITFGRSSRVDLVIVALPVAGEQRLAHVVDQLSVLPVDVKLPANCTALRFAPRIYSRVGNVAMIDLWDKPIADWGRLTKALFDRVIALAALVMLAPVMLAVAAAVRFESRGPVLFRQRRYGFNNEMIDVFKFRSMFTDRGDAQGTISVFKGDPRVTKVGRFIRKTSLDELPQLFNVLAGSLSLVGPRPHATQSKAGGRLFEEAVDGYFARHKVKPGITGWAQINGWRGETDTAEKLEQRVAHDMHYVENWSPLFDLYILIRTPLSLLNTRSAY